MLRPADAEPDLIRRAQAGDTTAFDALYASAAGRVFAVLLRLCADREQAERLTQDTFVTAWRRLGTFRGQSRFTSWLHRIAVNAMLQDGRSTQRREARVTIADDAVLNAAPGRASGADARIDLERAIAQLPPGARSALVLHDVEGYTHNEIAAMTGVAPGTVKSQLHRARRLLQERLER
ncbi:MAG TPA: sigma-70 family RNA polymerase sigma factor [Longimicrobiales bacterium]|nr:sigma-70 family RNA polymerase sigma factor [Longimicrobiales bacterium]